LKHLTLPLILSSISTHHSCLVATTTTTTHKHATLQDFEALTPNLLARTVETVEGGGLVILLLSSLSSLTQLYTLTMDVHARLRTDAHQTVTGVCAHRRCASVGAGLHGGSMDGVTPT
jgi:tRNA(Met) C34 N-acetyltransferase TmcA